MKAEIAMATVIDDTHRDDAGTLVPDGGLALRIPDLAGPDREGWEPHVLKWIRPMFTGLWEIPKVGASVVVYSFESDELRWVPWSPETDLPSWFADAGSYPRRNGIQSRDGGTQLVLDETDGCVHVGLATATRRLGLWDDTGTTKGLRSVLLNICGADESSAAHTHVVDVVDLIAALAPYFVATGAPHPLPGVEDAPSGGAVGWVNPVDAKADTTANEPAATKAKGA